jgi:hypothetical protein
MSGAAVLAVTSTVTVTVSPSNTRSLEIRCVTE